LIFLIAYLSQALSRRFVPLETIRINLPNLISLKCFEPFTISHESGILSFLMFFILIVASIIGFDKAKVMTIYRKRDDAGLFL